MPPTVQKRRFTFEKSQRLLKRSDFLRVQDGKAIFRTPWFVLLRKPNELGFSRFGLTVSKRVGKAVKRNRARRLLRELIRMHRPEFLAADYVFIALYAINNAQLKEMEAALIKFLRGKANISLSDNEKPSEDENEAKQNE